MLTVKQLYFRFITMPAPFKMRRNPYWTAENDQPEFIPYGPRDENHGGQGQANTVPHATPNPRSHPMPNMPRHPQGIQHHQMPSAVGPAPTTQPRPAPYAGPASNAGGLVHNDGPYNTTGAFPGNENVSRAGGSPNYGVPTDTGGYTHGQMQPMHAQPSGPQPVAQTQTNTQTGDPDTRSITGDPAPTPLDDEARIQALIPEVKRALRSSRKGNPCSIKNLNDLRLNEMAEKLSRRRGGPDLCGDMPQDEATQQQYAGRLFNAMINIEGIESRVTRTNSSKRDDRPVDSVGVKCVKERNGRKFELVAWKFFVSVHLQPIPLICPVYFKE